MNRFCRGERVSPPLLCKTCVVRSILLAFRAGFSKEIRERENFPANFCPAQFCTFQGRAKKSWKELRYRLTFDVFSFFSVSRNSNLYAWISVLTLSLWIVHSQFFFWYILFLFWPSIMQNSAREGVLEMYCWGPSYVRQEKNGRNFKLADNNEMKMCLI